jgi:chromosome partitioning protein
MLLVPLAPTMMDFASTLRFIDWLNACVTQLPGIVYRGVRFLVTNYESSAAHEDSMALIGQILGDNLLETRALHSSEIQRAAQQLKSIYELHRPIGHRDAWRRACESMDAVSSEILDTVEKLWANASDAQQVSVSGG